MLFFRILNKLVTNDTFQPERAERSKTQDIVLGTGFLSINAEGEAEHLENRNKDPNLECINKVNGHSEATPQSPTRTEPLDTDSSVDMGISKSTEDLSPQRSGPIGSVVKSHSITNMETGGLKIYDIISDNGPQQPSASVKVTSTIDGKNGNIYSHKTSCTIVHNSIVYKRQKLEISHLPVGE